MARKKTGRKKCAHIDDNCIYVAKNVRLDDGKLTGLPIMQCPRCRRVIIFPEEYIPRISQKERNQLNAAHAKKGYKTPISWD
jgi:hypothetical protein